MSYMSSIWKRYEDGHLTDIFKETFYVIECYYMHKYINDLVYKCIRTYL